MSKRLPIKAITFDLDDTLWSIWPIIDRAERLLHIWLTEHYPRIPKSYTPLKLRELCSIIAHDRPDIAHDHTALRKASLRLAATYTGYTTFDVEQAFAIFFSARNNVELFTDVRPTLEHLAQHYTLASLTNGNADIKQIGLDDVFTFSLNAIDVGAAKPAAPMFEAACQRLAMCPEQIVHVGDDPVFDIQGAAEAGFRTVWINRHNQSWPETTSQADAMIHSLDELDVVLATWNTDNR
ncbi:MAG: HAD family hydrolase [Candidatus Contendobacter odensis]|uniref:HAD family hydrolase n=1 Tax=Candidatus Contendibacter odensensis TaxID=1400860 RepID=A0A2G6PF25_9GAMM|nr:MAG: HAD family hydrolase [Candidatus Contendobacter odensis]